MYDYIIDSNWTGKEGTSGFTPSSGHFKIYSSLKAAFNDGVPFNGRTWVGPGTYHA